MKAVIVLCILGVFYSTAISQQLQRLSPTAAPFNERVFREHRVISRPIHNPQPGVSIPLQGTTAIGLDGMYQQQFANRGLHNIVVDPDHPQNLHAAVTFAQNITDADTVAGKDFLPQLQVYYLFSSDDGATWSAPKPIDTGRTSIPELILIKRGSEYVPVIAAVRNVADTTAPEYCSLYIEQGSAGTGDFREFRTDRKTYYDSLRNISFPSIALSHDGKKIFMAAGINNYDPETPQYIQLGTFTLNEDGKSAAWSGWKQGPNGGTIDVENSQGLAFPWSISVRVSPQGKVGICWFNRNFGIPDETLPDLSFYMSESADDGVTWPATPTTILTPIETAQDLDPKGNPYLLVAFNSDFWYAGERAECLLGGFYYNLDSSAGYYIPESGTLIYWNNDMSKPVLLLSKENDTEFGSTIIDGSWLASWRNTAGGTDIQGLTNLLYPTVARNDDPNDFSIYFSAWVDGEIQDMTDIGDIDDGTYLSYPYYSIWRIWTLDGGKTFVGPDMVRGNDPLDPDAQKYDYRSIETAPWNPEVSGQTVLHLLFNVDSNAGVISYGGNPGYDNVSWLFQTTQWAGVTEAPNTDFNTIVYYPNPFTTETLIPITITESEQVSLTVSDLLGRTVYQWRGMLEPSAAHLKIDGSMLGAGSYPFVLMTGSERNTGVLTISK